MSKFNVGDKVVTTMGPGGVKGKVVRVDAYGSYPVVVSWEDGFLTNHKRDTNSIEIIKEPRVVYVNEYDGVGVSCNAYRTEEEAIRAGVDGGRGRRILKFVEVIE